MMGGTFKLKVVAGPMIAPPWSLEGRGPKAAGDNNYVCGTCDYALYVHRHDGEIKGERTVKCPVCGSTLRA